MVGLGEATNEVLDTMRDLRRLDVDVLMIGQYLQPSRQHLSVARYYTPEEFAKFRERGGEMGFRWVESGPLARSSYNAEAQARALSMSSDLKNEGHSDEGLKSERHNSNLPGAC
jgi:lipoic acid synthetase